MSQNKGVATPPSSASQKLPTFELDLYAILEVSHNTDQRTLMYSYRGLLEKARSIGDQELSADLRKANDSYIEQLHFALKVLTNPQQRQKYHEYRAQNPTRTHPAAMPFNIQDGDIVRTGRSDRWIAGRDGRDWSAPLQQGEKAVARRSGNAEKIAELARRNPV